MNSKIAIAIKHYLFGMLAASWNGGIGAAAGIIGVAGASTVGVPDVQVLSYGQMASAFGGAFILHAIMWLKNHPIPEKLSETNPPIPPSPSP